jgi:hypothetical protein
MELNLYKSILLGTLKPWLLDNQKPQLLKANTTLDLVNPKSIEIFRNEKIRIFGLSHECLTSDGLEIYLAQPKNKEIAVFNSFFIMPFTAPLSPLERFYFALIRNEYSVLSSRLFEAINRKIHFFDKKLIVNTAINNIKNLIQTIGNQKSVLNTLEPTSINIVTCLKSALIKILYETQMIYENLLVNLPLDKHQIYLEMLNEDVPTDFDSWLDQRLLKEAKSIFDDINSDLPKSKFIPSDALSFGFNGNLESLKNVCQLLDKNYEMFADPTTGSDFYNILTSKNITNDSPKIYLNRETLEFRYIIDSLKIKFSDLNPTNIEKSACFFSKTHPDKPINRQNLYASKSAKESKNKATIDSILNHLK